MKSNIMQELEGEALLLNESFNKISEEIKMAEKFLSKLNVKIEFIFHVDHQVSLEWSFDDRSSRDYRLLITYMSGTCVIKEPFIESKKEIRKKYHVYLDEFLVSFKDHIQQERLNYEK